MPRGPATRWGCGSPAVPACFPPPCPLTWMFAGVYREGTGLVPVVDQGQDLPTDALARDSTERAVPAGLVTYPGVISTSNRPGPT